MNIREKAALLVDINDVKQIEKELEKRQQLAKSKGMPPHPQLFSAIIRRIYSILKQNYLNEFY